MTTHISHPQLSRSADRPGDLVGPPTLDLRPVERDWLAPTRCVGGFERLASRNQDGRLHVTAVGSAGPRPGEWATVVAEGVYAASVDSRSGYAVRALHDDGTLRSLVHTYTNVGVVALHGFHHVRGGGVPDYATRQICVPANRPWPDGQHVPEPTDLPADLRDARANPTDLVGQWINSQPGARGLERLEFAADGDHGVTVHAWGTGPDGSRDWGGVEARLYVLAANPTGVPTALATFDLEFVRVHLEARFNDGLLVVSQYAEFTDGSGRSDYMLREAMRR